MTSWKAARSILSVQSRGFHEKRNRALWPLGMAMATVVAGGVLIPSDARNESLVVRRFNSSFPSTQWKPFVPSMECGLPVRKDMRPYYSVGSVLGQGGFGLVHLGREKSSDTPVAIKHICKKTTSKDKFLQEVEILRLIGGRHNVVGLREAFETSDSYVLVTELVEGQELFEHLINEGTFVERQAKTLVEEISQSLAYLHAHGVVHGDIKPENILLSSDSSMRLIDFGQSFREHESRERLRCIGSGVATIAYAAPEVVSMQNSVTGSAMDMWALGVVLYILLCGYHPFDPENNATDEELRDRILAGKFETKMEEWLELSAPAQDLIQQLLQTDPANRMTAEEVLQHPWMVECTNNGKKE